MLRMEYFLFVCTECQVQSLFPVFILGFAKRKLASEFCHDLSETFLIQVSWIHLLNQIFSFLDFILLSVNMIAVSLGERWKIGGDHANKNFTSPFMKICCFFDFAFVTIQNGSFIILP